MGKNGQALTTCICCAGGRLLGRFSWVVGQENYVEVIKNFTGLDPDINEVIEAIKQT